MSKLIYFGLQAREQYVLNISTYCLQVVKFLEFAYRDGACFYDLSG